MDEFNVCLSFTLFEEGGYVNSPQDPGGATNMGITLTTLREWTGDKELLPRDVEAMTRATAAAIYRIDYWDNLHCQSLPPGVDLMVFDHGVLAGRAASALILQRVLGFPDYNVDGFIGAATIAAVRKAEPQVLLLDLYAAQKARIRSTANFETYGEGWLARVQRRFARAKEIALVSIEVV